MLKEKSGREEGELYQVPPGTAARGNRMEESARNETWPAPRQDRSYRFFQRTPSLVSSTR